MALLTRTNYMLSKKKTHLLYAITKETAVTEKKVIRKMSPRGTSFISRLI